MNNETDIGIKFSASVNGNKKLQELASSLTTIKAVADGLNTGAIDSIEVSSNEMKEISKNTKNTANVMKLAFNFSTVRMFARTLGNVTKELTRLANKSSDYLENVNLFQVAFDGNYRSAEKFVNKLSEMYGLDESRLTRVVGIFKQLSNAMNVSAETGEKLAKLMTQMSLDISSLYNVDFERSVSVLQSAISGQTKPIRGTTGADITQSTLQTTLDSLGIDRAVNQLTFAEKRLLIIISLTDQLKESINDLGRTIESPANQLKVLSEQWQRLSRALGNTFLPILAKILPYLNAIMMVLTEIINMIAKLFGYKEEDYDYFTGADEAVMNLEDSLGKATAGVGKLKKAMSGLRSFDKLNVISTPASGGSAGGSAGLGTGIDPDILKAFNNAFDSYQDKLENVRMKASKIRDSIMEWLGFTKEIDPLTGKIVWKYQGIKTTLSNLWKWFEDLSPLAKTLVTYLGYIFGAKVLNGAKKLLGLFTNLTPIKTMNTEFGKMVKYISVWSSATKSKKDGFIMGIDQWKSEASAIERIQTALGGLITTGIGLVSIKTSMDSINDSGLNLLNTLGLVGGELATVFGGAMMGASIGGGWGAVIGGISAGVFGLIDALLHYETEQDKIEKKAKEHFENIKKSAKDIQKSIADTEMEITSQMSMTNFHEKLVGELDEIIDENGKIKKGYEDRANYILKELSEAYGVEYELIDGNLKNSEQFTEEIKKQIALKEQEILLEAYKEDYIEALKNQNKYYKEYNDSLKKQKEQYDALNEITQKYGMTYDEYRKIMKETNGELDLNNEKHKQAMVISRDLAFNHKGEVNALEDYDKAVKKSGENYQKNADLVAKYADFQAAVISGDIDEINKKRDEYTKTYVVDGKIMVQSDKEHLDQQALNYQTDLQRWKKNNDERYEDYKNSLREISNETDEATPEIVQKWVALGSTSSKDFIEEMKQIPDDMQRDIISKMYEQGYEISDELQKGLNAFDISKTIKVEADTTKAKNAINKLVGPNTSFGKAMAKLGIQIPTLAVGGMPQVGQIFVANEKGPELVGNIGGQSFVANQNQMMELLDKKLGNAQQKKEPTTINIYLDENHKLGTYTLEQLEGMAKTNGKPIKIG